MTAAVKLTPRIARRLRDYLATHSQESEARSLLEEIATKRTTRKALVLPGRTREERRAERRESIASIRLEVINRAHGVCELPGCGNLGRELHHAVSGPERRSRESVSTCLLLCTGHHVYAHRGDELVLAQLAGYCTEMQMHEAAKALVRRLEKIHEAREAAGRTTP